MLPGPVFQVELLTTSRRKYHYILRFLQGAILLLVLWLAYQSSFPGGAGESYSVDRLARFAMDTFLTIAIVQAIAVLFLTPALVSGVIAQDRQRKTLQDMLMSRLTSAEIVLGKLAARLLSLGVFMALGLPVMSLITLLGGVDPRWILSAYGITFTSTLWLAAISVGISSIASNIRDATIASYLICLAWALVPPFVEGPVRVELTWLYPFLMWLSRPLMWTNPFWLMEGAFPGPASIPLRLGLLAGAQGLAAFFLIGLTTLRLRPAFRNEGGVWKQLLPRRRKERRGRRLFPRSRLSDDPMMWKERYASRFGRFTKVAESAAVLIVSGIVLWVLVDWGWPALLELAEHGYGAKGRFFIRDNFHEIGMGITPLLYSLIALGVAAVASGTVTGEKERQTWISLLTTDLSGSEIVRSKLAASVWTLRGFLLPLLGLWIVLLFAGSLHPLGLLAQWFGLLIFLWFAASLGMYFSLRCSSSGRALAWTISTMVVLNGGYLIPVMLLLYDDSVIVAAGCSPMILSILGISTEDVWTILGFSEHTYYWPGTRWEVGACCVLGLTGYFTVAVILTIWMIGRFERIVGRPRRSSDPRPSDGGPS